MDPRVGSRQAVSAPAVTSHSRMVLSQETEARRPSGSMHHFAATQCDCPSRRWVLAPAVTSQSRMVLSWEPEARRPSGQSVAVRTQSQLHLRIAEI
jgi:hypothetical protein